MAKFNAFIEPTAFWNSLKLILLFLAGILNFLVVWRFFLHLKDFSKDQKFLRLLLASAGSGLFFVLAGAFSEQLSSYPFPHPTPSPYPSPTPVPTPTPLEVLIQQELQKLTEGQIAFNPSENMKQGETERVEARITSQQVGSKLVEGLKGRGVPQVESIKVANFMKVSLYGESDEFQIQELSSKEQVVAGRDYAQWEWSVTPLSFGQQALHLKATASVKFGEFGEKSIDVPVIDKTIKVSISPLYIVSSTAKKFDWWQYLLGGGVLLSIAGAIWRFFTKKERRRAGFYRSQ